MPTFCNTGCGRRAFLKRPKTGHSLCKECFFYAFEEEVHYTIESSNLFSKGDYVAIAASGGKDSTVLAHLMCLLNERHHYGLKLILLSIDEGISGYRDDSLETVKRNEKQYNIPLKILTYEELYGWTMDRIVKEIGLHNNCTFCGVFRRQALDRGAQMLGVDKLVTGHNADDIAETVVMNVLRGDVARLTRCTSIETGSEGFLPRSKPFKYTYEKEIVLYAYFKKLDYFSTECVYSPNAYRGHARSYIKNLEKIRPSTIIDIIHSGECLSVKEAVKLPQQSQCRRCGYVSSQDVCKACVLLEGLNKGLPRLGISKTSKVSKKLSEISLLDAVTSEYEDPVGIKEKHEKNVFKLPVTVKSPNVSVSESTEPAIDKTVATNDGTGDQENKLLDVAVNNTELVQQLVSSRHTPKSECKVFSPRKKISDVSVDDEIAHDTERSKCSNVSAGSIEDIGDYPSICTGSCAENCKNKKPRKKVSLQQVTSSALASVPLGRKFIDF